MDGPHSAVAQEPSQVELQTQIPAPSEILVQKQTDHNGSGNLVEIRNVWGAHTIVAHETRQSVSIEHSTASSRRESDKQQHDAPSAQNGQYVAVQENGGGGGGGMQQHNTESHSDIRLAPARRHIEAPHTKEQNGFGGTQQSGAVYPGYVNVTPDYRQHILIQEGRVDCRPTTFGYRPIQEGGGQ